VPPPAHHLLFLTQAKLFETWRAEAVVALRPQHLPTLVAEYQTMLPSKAVLRSKLHELYVQLAPGGDDDAHGEGHGALEASAKARPRRPTRAARPKRKARRS
jgi:hypothetical protein